MQTTIDHVQGWTPAGLGKPVTRHGMPASVAARDNSQFRSVRLGRPPRLDSSLGRGNCGAHRRPAFLFTPVSIDIDEIHELRICELTGRQPVLACAQALTDHREAVPAVSRQVDQSSKSSSSAVFDEKHRSERQLECGSRNRGMSYLK